MGKNVKCPYCGDEAEFVGGKEIYPHRPDLYKKRFYLCKDCDAYVGCHAPNKKYNLNGDEPLGRLANPSLRKWKRKAHAAFDPLWKSTDIKRKEAYRRLAVALGIRVSNCHIGMFDEEMCKLVVEVCENGEVNGN